MISNNIIINGACQKINQFFYYLLNPLLIKHLYLQLLLELLKNPHLWTCLGSMAAAQAVIVLYSAIFRRCLQDSNPNEAPPFRRAAIVHGCPFDTHGPCRASCPAHLTWMALKSNPLPLLPCQGRSLIRALMIGHHCRSGIQYLNREPTSLTFVG